MIDNKLQFYQTRAGYDAQAEAGNIPNDALVFVKDTHEIITHGEEDFGNSDKYGDVAYIGDQAGTAVTPEFNPQDDTVWTKDQVLSDDKKDAAQANILNKVAGDGMGKVILKKNMVSGVNTLTQDMFYKTEGGERIPNTNTIYVIRYDFTLAEDITIPANCVLQFDGGSISGEHTITGANTGIQAGLVKIFSTDVTLAGTWNVAEAYPEWFGAKGDGVSDDTKPIQNCLNIGGVVTFGEKRVYLLNTTLFPNQGNYADSCLRIFDNTYIEGNGATIKLADGFLLENNSSIFIGEEVKNISFKNLIIDGNSQNNIFSPIENQKFRCYFIGIFGGENIHIDECQFYNCPGRNVINLSTTKLDGNYSEIHDIASIKGCIFKTGGAYIKGSVMNPNQDDFSFIYTEFSNSVVEDNLIINLDLDTKEEIDGATFNTRKSFLDGYIPNSTTRFWSGGIEVHGDHNVVKNNSVYGCKPAVYTGCVLPYEQQQDVTIESNNFYYCCGGVNLFSTPRNSKDFIIRGNYLNNAYNGAGIGVVGNEGDSFENLIIENNTITAEPYQGYRYFFGITIPAGKNIKVLSNNISVTEAAIVIDKESYEDCQIANNSIINALEAFHLSYLSKISTCIISNNSIETKYDVTYDSNHKISEIKRFGRCIAFSGLEDVITHSSHNWDNVSITSNLVVNVYSISNTINYDLSPISEYGCHISIMGNISKSPFVFYPRNVFVIGDGYNYTSEFNFHSEDFSFEGVISDTNVLKVSSPVDWFFPIGSSLLFNNSGVRGGIIIDVYKEIGQPITYKVGRSDLPQGTHTITTNTRKRNVGTTRPTNPYKGELFFDETLNKPIWYKGSNVWVDATGASV